eukprot:1145686-Pelagomonas_calceolata.AAC.1
MEGKLGGKELPDSLMRMEVELLSIRPKPFVKGPVAKGAQQQGKGARLNSAKLPRRQDKELPMNSAAYRLIKAQSDLVARTYALSMSMRQHS